MITRAIHLKKVVVLAALAVAGCEDHDAAREAIQSLDGLNVIDESSLNDLLLDYADPDQAVKYFQGSLAKEPQREDLQRGLSRSLFKAGRKEEAIQAFGEMERQGTINDGDRILFADSAIQLGKWDVARGQLGKIPPTVETYDRYRLEALMADHAKQWQRADSYYGQARDLTTRPAPIYNNWGISKVSRGDRPGAEEMFTRAISFDRNLFSAKNNLAISRASRRVYDLPIVPMTKAEQAELLHNIALQAIRNGDVDIGRGLLETALETHPRYFPEAADKLAALNKSVLR